MSSLNRIVPEYVEKWNQQDEALWDQLMEIVRQLEPALGYTWYKTIAALKGKIDVEALQSIIESGNTQQIADLLTQDPDVMAAMKFSLSQAILNAAIASSGVMSPAALVFLRQDSANPEAVRVMEEQSARLVQQVNQGIRELIAQVGSNGLQSGIGPAEMARQIRDNIGLTASQYQAVANYRRELETGKSGALNRALRDARFDRTVQAAIDGGKTLPADVVDKLVGRYRERYIIYRSEVIARNEALTALAQGRRLSWLNAIQQGVVSAKELRKFPHTARDERVCPICAPVPSMNPNGVGIDDDYETPDGPDQIPFHIQCRCVDIVRLVSANDDDNDQGEQSQSDGDGNDGEDEDE